MKLRKNGQPDKRFKAPLGSGKPPVEAGNVKQMKKDIKSIGGVTEADRGTDPNELHTQLLKDNNLKLDFDVLEGTIATKYGILKLEKPTLVIKASYVTTK